MRFGKNSNFFQRLIFIVFLFVGFLTFFIHSKEVFAEIATSTVYVTICGDGVVNEGEVCDSGSNNGHYATSIAERYCDIGCLNWAAYCGDRIIQGQYGEVCDDGNNASGDGCSADCTEIQEVPGGGAAGGGPFIPGSQTPTPTTKVVIIGKAYPYADVNILKEGKVIGIVPADSQGDFTFEVSEVTPGVGTFSFWAQDRYGLKSVALSLTFQVTANAVTTIRGAYLPPTIGLDKRAVKKGEVLKMFGQTISRADVFVHISSPEEIVEKIKSQPEGDWKLDFNTAPLKEEEFHTAKALFQTEVAGSIIKSAFSQLASFYIGEGKPPKIGSPDLNGDGKVNLIDFSILIYYWGTKNPVADINADGIVNLADFSILIYHWTG